MNLKRRAFIKAGVAAGTGVALAPLSLSSMVSRSSTKTIRIGFVGVGSRPVQFPDFTRGSWRTCSPKGSIFIQ